MARNLALASDRTDKAPNTVLETMSRSYLTEDEVEALLKATACERDRCMILMGFIHGLRVSELIGLQRSLPVGCRFVFMTRLGAPMTRQGFGKIHHRLVYRGSTATTTAPVPVVTARGNVLGTMR